MHNGMRSAAPDGLALHGGANGASAGASAALDALISVDDVLAVAFSDGINGAFSLASAASDAFVSDNVSHGYTSNKFESSLNLIRTCISLSQMV